MDELEQIISQAKQDIEQADSTAVLAVIETKYLGSKGSVQAQLRSIGSLPKEERPSFGARVNAAKEDLTRLLVSRRESLAGVEIEQQLKIESIDVTLPGRAFPMGRKHP